MSCLRAYTSPSQPQRDLVMKTFFAALAATALLGTPSLAQTSGAAQAPAAQSGQHDFDPLIGTWKFHLKRRLNPLTGSNSWVEYEGTGVCYKIWDGRADLDTIELDSPSGHIEGLTLRTYNPQTQQRSLYWANSKDGTVVPPQIGQFKG